MDDWIKKAINDLNNCVPSPSEVFKKEQRRQIFNDDTK